MAGTSINDLPLSLEGSFNSPPGGNIHFGPGSIAKLAAELDIHGVRRALVVTGKTLHRNHDLMAKLSDALGDRLVGVADEATFHTSYSDILEIAEQARSTGADGLISFGGGSPNDAMKIAALALSENIRDEAGFDALSMKFEHPGGLRIPKLTGQLLPTFAIPTTLSAGEFSAYAGMIDRKDGVKVLFHDSGLAAKTVILDPELTLATPERLWLASGIKAVDHCVETLLSKSPHVYADALASHALGILHPGLKACRQDPQDIEARGRCLIAAWLSFCNASTVRMGLSHGIGIILGARYGVPHGETSCVLIHNMMQYNQEPTLGRQAWIAHILGVAVADDMPASAVAAQQEILGLVRDDLGLPWRLRDVNIARNEIPSMVQEVMQGYLPTVNPRPMVGADLEEVLYRAW